MTIITGLWLASYFGVQIVWKLPQECVKNGWDGCYYPTEKRFFIKKGYDSYTNNLIQAHEIGHYCYSSLYGDMSEESAYDFENFIVGGAIDHDLDYYVKLIKDCKKL